MTNFIQGFKIIFPIFFIMGIGYFSRQKGLISKEFIDGATKLVFYFALPVSLFLDVVMEEKIDFSPRYIAFILGGILLTFFLALIIGKLFIKDVKKLTAFVHTAFRGNFVYVGFPIIYGILGDLAPSESVPIIAFGITVYNLLAISMLTYYHSDKINVRDFILKIVTNPMIIATMGGFIVRGLHYVPQGMIYESLNMLAKLATPLALILVGGSLNFKVSKEDKKIIWLSAIYKDILMPLMIMPAAILMGFNREELVVTYVFSAVPPAINTFLYAKKMGSDYKLTSQILAMSFALSVFTFTLGIGIFKHFNIF